MSNLMLPGNPRYQPKNLVPYFGYDNIASFLARVEIATMEVLGDIGVISKEDINLLTPHVSDRLLAITTTQMDEVERKVTKHDVRAWVRLAQEVIPEPLRRWVHVPLTSYDGLSSAYALQFLEAHTNVVRPLVRKVIVLFAHKVETFADVVQIGRTHGQHAIPITVGFWFATILHRIALNAADLDKQSALLAGKISGPVGCYNSQVATRILEKCGDFSFEKRVLSKLGLQASAISTQIPPPEILANYLFAAIKLCAAFGQFGRDGRHLMRTEIAEIGEPFAVGQVGSSTMAHKRNPITFENLEGMWLRTKNEFGKVLDTLLSDHQRDLVGSCVMRDFPIIIVNLVQQLNTLLRENDKGVPFMGRIDVDIDALRASMKAQSDVIMAEPIYLALQMAGYKGDAHELVNHRAMRLVMRNEISLIDAVKEVALEDEQVALALRNISPDMLELFGQPARYVGLAKEKALEIVGKARSLVNFGAY